MLNDPSSDGLSGGVGRSAVAALIVAVLLTTAGCTSAIPGSGDGGGNGPATDSVPAGVDAITYVDVQGMLSDDALRSVGNEYFSLQSQREYYAGPENVSEVVEEFENSSTLEMEELHGVTLYSRFAETNAGSDEYVGIILDTGWSEEDVVSNVENESYYSLEKREFNGKTLYAPSESYGEWYGVLSEGTFVTGNETAVKDALKVASGDAEAVSGDLREQFEDTREGYFRYALNVPQDRIPAERAGDMAGSQFSGLNTGVFNKVTTVAGAGYTDDDTVGFTIELIAESESAASDMKDVTEGAISLTRGMVNESSVKTLLEEEGGNLVVDQAGQSVTITSENAVSDVNAVLDFMYNRTYATSYGEETAA